ncbi:TraR/DksA family transcriptional regulator [Acidovorax soli]|uniref:TraR/DksA family transcriptional regulator n=1 Tax=Acidovorax TaxID=12916 RepID=UPI0026EA5C61|nr:TraR/DksA C4-type zinc finger protein [Acidovorax soli]MCM2345708.1 TraR/DksA C4-type zinc finger protein [Acidovorax soli]
MNATLTTAQRDELKALLLAARHSLESQMQQNRENLAPPVTDQDGIEQGNVVREVDQALTNIDAADVKRIDHALEAMEDGSYGLCAECGCAIPFDRLKIEPQTQHCVACKSRWEQGKGHAKTHA